jgi:hypothetical protein
MDVDDQPGPSLTAAPSFHSPLRGVAARDELALDHFPILGFVNLAQLFQGHVPAEADLSLPQPPARRDLFLEPPSAVGDFVT